MQQNDSLEPEPLQNDAVRIGMMQAVAGKLLVTVTYNSREMTLAPHALFLRHGAMYVSALNLDKKWRSDESPRLGHFKLAGLSNISVTEQPFEPLSDFDGAAPHANDELVLAVA